MIPSVKRTGEKRFSTSTIIITVIIFSLTAEGCKVSGPAANDLNGYIAAEGRGFLNEPLYSGQKRNNASLAIQPEFYHEWQNGMSFTFVPFGRFDSSDSERSHFDIRELNFLWPRDTWELRMGMGKVFWGATEFVHLVDIINQTDLKESIDAEEKLGQPMFWLTVSREWGLLEFFVLPWFRERTFPGRQGRLRYAFPVDTGKARYENSDKARHIDLACRYSHTIGDVDIGISHFLGTGREPTLVVEPDANGSSVLVPLYEQINQTGTDIQFVAGEWLWKLEAILRSGQGEPFFSVVGGVEYTIVGVAGTGIDLGLIGEWAYDERGERATTPFENDLMIGLRIAVNDAASTELLTGALLDMDSSARLFTLEASRRIGTDWKANLEAYVFSNQPQEDILHSLRDDDYLSLTLAYYF